MAEINLTLTAEEHQYLVNLLREVLKAARIEEHRTRTPLFRANVLNQETTIVSLLNKLGQAPG
jgi:hypothetical protein